MRIDEFVGLLNSIHPSVVNQKIAAVMRGSDASLKIAAILNYPSSTPELVVTITLQLAERGRSELSDALRDRLFQALSSHLQNMKPQSIDNSLWALINLGFSWQDFSPALQFAVFETLCGKASSMDEFVLVNSVWSLAGFGLRGENLSDKLQTVLLQALAVQLPRMNSEYITKSLLALAKFGFDWKNLSPLILQAPLLGGLSIKVRTMDVLSIYNCLWALAKLGLFWQDLSRVLQDALAESLLAQLSESPLLDECVYSLRELTRIKFIPQGEIQNRMIMQLVLLAKQLDDSRLSDYLRLRRVESLEYFAPIIASIEKPNVLGSGQNQTRRSKPNEALRRDLLALKENSLPDFIATNTINLLNEADSLRFDVDAYYDAMEIQLKETLAQPLSESGLMTPGIGAAADPELSPLAGKLHNSARAYPLTFFGLQKQNSQAQNNRDNPFFPSATEQAIVLNSTLILSQSQSSPVFQFDNGLQISETGGVSKVAEFVPSWMKKPS